MTRYHNKVDQFFSVIAHTLIIAQMHELHNQFHPFRQLILLITREIHISVPCHGAGSSLWTTCKCCTGRVAAASANLAAFQTSVEEDEGSLPSPLSVREQRALQHSQPTSVDGRRGETRGGEGRRGEREARPEPAAHAASGDGRGCTRHATPKLCGGYLFHNQMLFSERWKRMIWVCICLFLFLPMMIHLHYIQLYTSY